MRIILEKVFSRISDLELGSKWVNYWREFPKAFDLGLCLCYDLSIEGLVKIALCYSLIMKMS